MKKLTIMAAALIMLLVLAACNNGVAPIAQPDGPYQLGVLAPPPSADTANEIVDEVWPDCEYIVDDYDFGFGDDMWGSLPVFGSWTGTVVEIEVEYSYPPTYIFRLEGENGSAVFRADFNTFILGEAPEIGDTITGHYLMNAPMAMIYPPQYNVSVIVNGDFLAVTVDRFDENLLSYDGFLQLNIGDDTEIMLQSGNPIGADELAHRKLVVVYSVSTRSIPAQTTPEKIIVLYEGIATGPAPLF